MPLRPDGLVGARLPAGVDDAVDPAHWQGAQQRRVQRHGLGLHARCDAPLGACTSAPLVASCSTDADHRHEQLAVSVPTIRGALAGDRRVFAAPCLAQLRANQDPVTPNPSLADSGGRRAGAAERGEEMMEAEAYTREVRQTGASLSPEKDVSEALDRLK